jgi:hypothetical protein
MAVSWFNSLFSLLLLALIVQLNNAEDPEVNMTVVSVFVLQQFNYPVRLKA